MYGRNRLRLQYPRGKISTKRVLSLILAGAVAFTPCRAADLDEIVRRGGDVLESDWKAFSDYAYIERDETRKGSNVSISTNQVLMIAGSDYNLPIAVDDKPLSPERQKIELQKLRDEVKRRAAETPAAREQRLQKFRKEQDEYGDLILGFPKAFTYTLQGEEEKNGHPAYVLSAVPKKRAGAMSRAAKVLAGMNGIVWIDRTGFHTIRAECQVTAPVPMYGFLAHVLPGTQVVIELTPFNDSVWLISRFTLTLAVSKLWFKSTELTDSTYSQFRPNAMVLAELLARTIE
jgi:hypothetical protein